MNSKIFISCPQAYIENSIPWNSISIYMQCVKNVQAMGLYKHFHLFFWENDIFYKRAYIIVLIERY